MKESIRSQLLELNRHFYSELARAFDDKRQGTPPGLDKLLDYLPASDSERPIAVLDVGCGNGRFARILDKKSVPFFYVGIDGSAELLELAAAHTTDLRNGTTRFVQHDLTEGDWARSIISRFGYFDFVLCTAVLHHIPSYPLRLSIVQQLGRVANQVLILSSWQFLTSERFVSKRIPWTTLGLSEDDLEPGDALLPWKHGHYAIRYVHQLDGGEFRRLASDAKLTLQEEFYADGKEGNLSLYVILRPAPEL